MEATRHIQESERMIRLGRFDEAITMLTKVLEEDPLNMPALLNIGIAYTESGRNEAAIQAIGFYLKHDQDNAEAWEAIGCAHLRRKTFDEAERCFKKALEIAPENASVLRNYSILLGQTDRGRESYRMLRKSRAINPEDVLTTFALAAAYRFLGRREEALELYREIQDNERLPDHFLHEIERSILELSIGW